MGPVQWHPGTQGLATTITPRWAFPVHLLPAESLTSWLVRAALLQGCDPLVLTGWLWPGWRVWTLDADRGIPEERLSVLSHTSGIAADALQAATIEPIATRIQGERPDRLSTWPWTLTIGARNRKRNGGIQFCPACLEADDTPYFRLPWRFAWHTACATHDSTLLDRCTVCTAAVAPHRLPAMAANPAVCATCATDLREAHTGPCRPETLAFQQAADQVALQGFGDCYGETWAAATWFAVADFLVALIRRANRSPTQGLLYLLRASGVVVPRHILPIPGARIERLRVEDRQDILAGVWRLMMLDAERLRTTLDTSGITRQGWCEKGHDVPEPLARLTPELPENPATRTYRPRKGRTGPRPRHEVTLMMRRLRRKLEMRTQ